MAMRAYLSSKTLVAVIIFACLGLIPVFTAVHSVFGSLNPRVTSDQLASLYSKGVPTERIRIETGRRLKEADAAAFMVTNDTLKVFLDCGANAASSVQLFRDTYPDAKDYVVHSFEIDDRLDPYFNPYRNHHLHCPVGVAAEYGNMTAYLESVWSPDKGLNNGKNMQWGGGTFFVDQAEAQDQETGGKRKLSTRRVVPTIDLAEWIVENFSREDYVILKLDVEGAEFNILKQMLQLGAFDYIDKLYGEYHNSQPTGWTTEGRRQLVLDVGMAGFTMMNWEAEKHTYKDFETIHPPDIPISSPGKAGEIYSVCESGAISIAVAVGMNLKRAQKLVSTLQAYPTPLSLTLFVYGDFVEQFPETVKAWARRFRIGVREDGSYPRGYLESMPSSMARQSLVSSILRLGEAGLKTAFYWPAVNETALSRFKSLAKARGLRLVQPVVDFPGNIGTELTVKNYYRYRDVERVPRALTLLHDQLTRTDGGILGLDSDVPDSYMISVFLMDYLIQKSDFRLVELEDCVRDGAPIENVRKFADIWN